MTEDGIIKIATLLISAATGVVTLWMRWKISRELASQRKDNAAVVQTVAVVATKVTAVQEKVVDVGKSIDGRLTQWKEEESKFTEMAVARARARGREEGRDDARSEAAALAQTAVGVAEGVLGTAQTVAADVIKTAEEKKKEI